MIVCRLAAMLAERGMSRRELARQSGLNLATICKLANADHRMIHIQTLERVCAALQMQPAELLVWEPDDQG